MKKFICNLFVLALLAASVIAAETNAPITAAEFVSNPDKDASTYGTLVAIVEDISVLENETTKNLISTGMLFNGSGATYNVTVPDNAFDVVLKVPYNDYKMSFAGATLNVFYNPEVIVPVYTDNLYTLVTLDFTDPSNPTSKKLVDILGKSVLAMDYETNYTLNTPAEHKQLGYLTYVKAATEDFKYISIVTSEMVRWPFQKVSDSDISWYRTKIYPDYTAGNFQGASFDAAAGKSEIWNVNIDTRAAYYINPDYNGPKFDIVGGMKKGEGELRFGSVYFIGEDEYFDNRAEIVEAGVVCYPSALLEDKVLTLETKGAVRIPATGYYTKDEKQMVYTGVLTGLTNASDMYITAKSYITYKDKDTGEEVTVYSDPIARNLKTADTENMK